MNLLLQFTMSLALLVLSAQLTVGASFTAHSSGKADVVVSHDGADYFRFGTAVWGANWAWTGVGGDTRKEGDATVGALSAKVGGTPLKLSFRAARTAPVRRKLASMHRDIIRFVEIEEALREDGTIVRLIGHEWEDPDVHGLTSMQKAFCVARELVDDMRARDRQMEHRTSGRLSPHRLDHIKHPSIPDSDYFSHGIVRVDNKQEADALKKDMDAFFERNRHLYPVHQGWNASVAHGGSEGNKRTILDDNHPWMRY